MHYKNSTAYRDALLYTTLHYITSHLHFMIVIVLPAQNKSTHTRY